MAVPFLRANGKENSVVRIVRHTKEPLWKDTSRILKVKKLRSVVRATKALLAKEMVQWQRDMQVHYQQLSRKIDTYSDSHDNDNHDNDNDNDNDSDDSVEQQQIIDVIESTSRAQLVAACRQMRRVCEKEHVPKLVELSKQHTADAKAMTDLLAQRTKQFELEKQRIAKEMEFYRKHVPMLELKHARERRKMQQVVRDRHRVSASQRKAEIAALERDIRELELRKRTLCARQADTVSDWQQQHRERLMKQAQLLESEAKRLTRNISENLARKKKAMNLQLKTELSQLEATNTRFVEQLRSQQTSTVDDVSKHFALTNQPHGTAVDSLRSQHKLWLEMDEITQARLMRVQHEYDRRRQMLTDLKTEAERLDAKVQHDESGHQHTCREFEQVCDLERKMQQQIHQLQHACDVFPAEIARVDQEADELHQWFEKSIADVQGRFQKMDQVVQAQLEGVADALAVEVQVVQDDQDEEQHQNHNSQDDDDDDGDDDDDDDNEDDEVNNTDE
jgi:hypothetical protein